MTIKQTIFLWYFIYKLSAGLYCYYYINKKLTLTKEEIDKLPLKERDETEKIREELYIRFGSLNIYPFIYYTALTMGWALIPTVISLKVMKFFEK